MQRIVVVGPPGSGKTTVARELARRLDLPHTELDSLWWEPNWVEAGREVFSERAASVVAGERWVVDGNYYAAGAEEVIWPRADTIVWLNQPRRVTVTRVVRRTVSRSVRRTELWSGNREPVALSLRPDSIVRVAWRAHPTYNAHYEGLDRDPRLTHVQWVRLCSPRAVRRWLRSLPGPPPW